MSEDDWKIIRSRQQHFTDAEVALIRERFRAGVAAPAVARELQCSSRVIQTHFAKLRGDWRAPERASRVKAAKSARPKPIVDRASRFYRSNFEPN